MLNTENGGPPNSTAIIPFGKYRGQPIDAVMQADPNYIEWLKQQDWFAEKFRKLCNVIQAGITAQSQETPEHNAMQARFLSDEYRGGVALASPWLLPKQISPLFFGYAQNRKRQGAVTVKWDLCVMRPHFEQVSDISFEVELFMTFDSSSAICSTDHRKIQIPTFNIELKPSLGDDYPAVLRQIHGQQRKLSIAKQLAIEKWDRQPAHLRRAFPTFDPQCWICLCDTFAARGASFEQVKEIYRNSTIALIRTAELPKTPVLAGEFTVDALDLWKQQ